MQDTIKHKHKHIHNTNTRNIFIKEVTEREKRAENIHS